MNKKIVLFILLAVLYFAARVSGGMVFDSFIALFLVISATYIVLGDTNDHNC